MASDLERDTRIQEYAMHFCLINLNPEDWRIDRTK